MRNPFKYLQDQREAKRAERLRDQEAERQARARAEQLRLARMQAAKQYNEMVMRLLGQLREAAYPTLDIHQDKTYPTWSIGKSVYQELWERTWYEWESAVTVELVFNESNQPDRFRCWCVESQPVECSLSEAELINALVQLHPPESAE